MRLSRRTFLGLQQAEPNATAAPPALAITPILHLLNRITWGPRPAEMERANAIGYEAFLDEQLDPARLDDAEADQLLQNLPILQMDRITAHSLPSREYRCYKALVRGMIVRAVYSRRQLLERVVEFWSDHFNIPAEDYAPDVVQFQREVIRKHALGNFRDLLLGTARSPAMLYYLNNAENVAEHPNENYARELMELHTLGVDGGYTERDVKEVARAFTGWTVHDGVADGFYFDPEVHDQADKSVLGRPLPGGRGLEDGLHVLGILTSHPATARFISRKLCVYFVSDNPPASLVESMAQVWRESQGNIKTVLRHLFLSAEFQQASGQKFRRPLDFFIGALRATGTTVGDHWVLDELLSDLGQPPYGWQPPNGYPAVAGAWLSTSGLLARWNIAMRLTHGAYSDAGENNYQLATDLRHRIGDLADIGTLVDAVATQIFGAPLTGAARAFFINYVGDGAPPDTPVTHRLLGRKLGSLYGLLLASPYYQWR